jgi:hypothetical protein
MGTLPTPIAKPFPLLTDLPSVRCCCCRCCRPGPRVLQAPWLVLTTAPLPQHISTTHCRHITYCMLLLLLPLLLPQLPKCTSPASTLAGAALHACKSSVTLFIHTKQPTCGALLPLPLLVLPPWHISPASALAGADISASYPAPTPTPTCCTQLLCCCYCCSYCRQNARVVQVPWLVLRCMPVTCSATLFKQN